MNLKNKVSNFFFGFYAYTIQYCSWKNITNHKKYLGIKSPFHFVISINHNDGFSDHTIAVNEQNEGLILFPYIMYYFYQTMNGNALSLKNVRLKKFIKTRCVLKDRKQCNNYAMYLIDSVQSVSLTESFCYHPTTSAYRV